MRSTCRSSSTIFSAISPSSAPGQSPRPWPISIRCEHAAISVRQGQGRGAAGRSRLKAGRGGTRFSLKLLPAPWGEDISLWSTFIQQSLGEIGIPVEIVRNDGGGFLKQVYDEHAFDLATGWHQYRNDPAVSTTVWYRSVAQGRALDQPVGLGGQDGRQDHRRCRDRSRPAKRKALFAQFVKEVDTELPVWMPIEQIFVTTITAKARNHSNTPRWGSTSWHDLWLSA